MTDAQRRILEDFADVNLVQRYRQDGQVRSTREEWEAERVNLLAAGWLESGFAIAGDGHRVTDKGRAALRLEMMKPGFSQVEMLKNTDEKGVSHAWSTNIDDKQAEKKATQ